MFEEYLQDANYFFIEGQTATSESNFDKAKRYYRASIFSTASAMESFVNYIANSLEMRKTLSPYETAFLNDKQIMFDSKKGREVKSKKYFSIEDKLKFLLRKFNPDVLSNNIWNEYKNLKKFRDSLIHPTTDDDETPVTEYCNQIQIGLTVTIKIMNSLSLGFYKKPLRKRILDLIPE